MDKRISTGKEAVLKDGSGSVVGGKIQASLGAWFSLTAGVFLILLR
jgi:hypothetical protein